MYLSRIKLNIQKRKTLIALDSPNLLHGAIERAFDGERKRNLWRIDKLHENLYLLILSEDIPNFTDIITQFGCDGECGETVDYDRLLVKIAEGTIWQFRLKANPVYSVKSEDEKRGKIMAHVTEEYQKKWLMDRAEHNGFRLSDDSFSVVSRQWLSFSKGDKNKVKISGAVFEGSLIVTDPEKFKVCLCKGIGKEKAYGFGMLTICR